MPVWKLRVFNLWIPVVFWCVVIFYFSSIQGLAGPWEKWDFFLRKAAHVTEYAILAFLVLRALQGHKLKRGAEILWAFSLSLLYAAGDEFHQLFVPERAGELKDVVIDSVGCALGVFLRKWIMKIYPPPPEADAPLAQEGDQPQAESVSRRPLFPDE